MAIADHHDRPVSDELVREHARGWEAFTHFMKYAIAGTTAVLFLMAVFLL